MIGRNSGKLREFPILWRRRPTVLVRQRSSPISECLARAAMGCIPDPSARYARENRRAAGTSMNANGEPHHVEADELTAGSPQAFDDAPHDAGTALKTRTAPSVVPHCGSACAQTQ